jgi:hypothetical protein
MVDLIAVYAPSDQARSDIEKRIVDTLAGNVRRCHERKDGLGGGRSLTPSPAHGGGALLPQAGPSTPLTPKTKVPKATAAASATASGMSAAAALQGAANAAAAASAAATVTPVVAGPRAGAFKRTPDHYILGNMYFSRSQVDALLTSLGFKPYGRDENDHLVNVAYFLVGSKNHDFRMQHVDPALGKVLTPKTDFYDKPPGGCIPIAACIDRAKSPVPASWPRLFR